LLDWDEFALKMALITIKSEGFEEEEGGRRGRKKREEEEGGKRGRKSCQINFIL